MTAEPLRFIHASQLRLDHGLTGLGPVPAEARDLVRDCSLIAWDRIVAACQTRAVDFLLLTGDGFDQADTGLRGKAALRDGCQRLVEAGISVFICEGEHDPWSAWPDGSDWPENAIRLGLDTQRPCEVESDHTPLACIYDWHNVELAGMRRARQREARGAYRIALACGLFEEAAGTGSSGTAVRRITREDVQAAAVDYWALGGQGAPLTVELATGLLHDPGPPVPFRPTDRGPRGCTLVELDEHGRPHLTRLATSPVRRLQLGVTLEAGMSPDSLMARMQRRLIDLPYEPGERLWMIDWTLDTESPLPAWWDDPGQRELIEGRVWETAIPGLLAWSQSVRTTWHALPTHEPSSDTAELWTRFENELVRGLPPGTVGIEVLSRLVEGSALREGPWGPLLQNMAPELDWDLIQQEARQLAWTSLSRGGDVETAAVMAPADNGHTN